jgi:hypothetical protein
VLTSIWRSSYLYQECRSSLSRRGLAFSQRKLAGTRRRAILYWKEGQSLLEGGPTSTGRRANLYWKEGQVLSEGGPTSNGRRAKLSEGGPTSTGRRANLSEAGQTSTGRRENLRVKKYRGPPELVQHFRL